MTKEETDQVVARFREMSINMKPSESVEFLRTILEAQNTLHDTQITKMLEDIRAKRKFFKTSMSFGSDVITMEPPRRNGAIDWEEIIKVAVDHGIDIK